MTSSVTSSDRLPAVIGRAGITFPDHASVDDDPVAAWAAVADTLQAALTIPRSPSVAFDAGPPGELSVEQAIDMLVTGDVLIHTWDLARATDLEGEAQRESLRRF